jgi:flagellar protein FlgJ
MSAIAPTQLSRMQATAREFEAMFVAKMLDTATAGLKTKGAFFGGQAEESFRSVLNEEYGKAVANAGPGLGLADMVLQEMLRLQGGGR